jgi:hypothetical protein
VPGAPPSTLEQQAAKLARGEPDFVAISRNLHVVKNRHRTSPKEKGGEGFLAPPA